MEETEGETTSALLNHCMAVYDAMHEESEEYLDGGYAPGEAPRIYIGMLTNLFVRLDYGISNYSRIVNAMRDMGCVEQIRRGAGKTPGMWLLWRRPDEALFEWVKTYNRENKERREDALGDSVEQRLRDMQTVINDLRDTVENLRERLEVIEDDDFTRSVPESTR